MSECHPGTWLEPEPCWGQSHCDPPSGGSSAEWDSSDRGGYGGPRQWQAGGQGRGYSALFSALGRLWLGTRPGWGLQCVGNGVGWSWASGPPQHAFKPNPHLPVPSTHQCSPLPPVTEGRSHPAVSPPASTPQLSSHLPVFPNAGILDAPGRGVIPSPLFTQGMERGQGQFCLETPGLRLASSLGESWGEGQSWEVGGTGRW